MSFRVIRAKLNSNLSAISNIQKVYNYPTIPDQFPAVTLMPSEQESDYETTTENLRKYSFIVKLFYQVDTNGTSYAIDALEGLVDEVVDAIDKNPTMTGISMPTGYTLLYLTPTPASWGYFIEQGYITADIKVEAIVSFDIKS